MITDILENTFNHLVQSDPQSKEKLASLAGKSVGFEIKGTALQWVARITTEGIKFMASSLEQADCILRGTPIALIRYMNSRQINPSTNATLGVEIEGDMEFARDISNILRKLDIDWEEIFSQVIGDLPAYQLSKVVSNFRSGIKSSKKSAYQHLQYLITERLDQVVSQDEAEAFYRDIDKTSEDAQRLERKINQITDMSNDA